MSEICKLQGNGYPFNISEEDRNILYNLPDDVRKYIIIVEPNDLIKAYLIYDNKIELIHVLAHDTLGNSPTKLYAARDNELLRVEKVLNFSDNKTLTEMIDILTEIRNT